MAEENDDLLDPSEIEKLLNSQGQETPREPPSAENASQSAGDDLLDPSDIEKLLQGAMSERGGETIRRADLKLSTMMISMHSLISMHLRQPISLEVRFLRMQKRKHCLIRLKRIWRQLFHLTWGRVTESPKDLGGTKTFEFPNFDSMASNPEEAMALSSLQNVELDLCIELGRTELLIEEVLKMKEGVVVPLDKLAGDPVDILVNGRIIARGEVLVLNDNFCVRVAEILSPEL